MSPFTVGENGAPSGESFPIEWQLRAINSNTTVLAVVAILQTVLFSVLLALVLWRLW